MNSKNWTACRTGPGIGGFCAIVDCASYVCLSKWFGLFSGRMVAQRTSPPYER